jgi:hypothetical protein
MLHLVIVCEKEQTFGIDIKAANRIHVVRERAKIPKRMMSSLARELRQHAIRLVEQEVAESRLHVG